MTFHPHKSRPIGGATGVNRVVEISEFDLVDPAPDPLCQLKRAVNEIDLIEFTDPATWSATVNLVDSHWRGMFYGDGIDRKRYRYRVYGYDDDALATVLTNLQQAMTAAVAGMTAWLRNTATSGDLTTWVNVLTTPSAIADPTRAGTSQADSSLLFSAAAPDVYSWGLSGFNYSTNYLAIYMWVKPTAIVGQQLLYSVHLGTGGASARALEIYTNGTALRFDVYSSGNNGRRHEFNAQFAAGVSRLIGFEFSTDGTGDARVVGTRDAVVLVPDTIADLSVTPETPTTLPAVTGNALIGNFNNSAVASRAYGGRIGRSLYARAGSKMTGVTTTGVLTQAARNALLAFEPLV